MGLSERTSFIIQSSAVLLALVAIIVGLTVGLRTPPPPRGGSPPDRSHLYLNTTTSAPSTAIQTTITSSTAKPTIAASSTATHTTPTSPTSTESTNITRSPHGQYTTAAVASDGDQCSTIGKEILKRNGSAVDAAIAGLICNGVVNPQSMGIGGGDFMVIYDTPRNGTQKQIETIIAREMAPRNASKDMFVDNPMEARDGGKSIAVPGSIKGYWNAHQKYGKLEWRELFQPSINLCRNGVPVNGATANAILAKEKYIRNNTAMREVFTHHQNGSLLQKGDIMKLTNLGKTLDIIAEEGEQAFYNGSLTHNITMDIQEQDGIITTQDLNEYSIAWKKPINVTLQNGNYTLYSATTPSSGSILLYALNILDGYGFNNKSRQSREKATLTYHRIIEAFKYAYARRSEMGDHENDPKYDLTELLRNLTSDEYADETRLKIDDNNTYGIWHYHPGFEIPQSPWGTSHLSVYAPDGSAVAVTSTINLYFGSKIMGSRTGIIFNDEMDDFSTPNATNAFELPPSPANYIVPGKRPMSSMSPLLAVDKKSGKVALVVGAAGGTKITSATAYVSLHTLWFGESLHDAVDTPRLHHQLAPNEIRYEYEFPQGILEGLEAKGHNTSIRLGLATAQAIHNACLRCTTQCQPCIHACADKRRGTGKPDGF